MGQIRIGTSGWSYDDWRGIVYPPNAPSRFDRMLCLAALFDTLEVNSSFYRIPSLKTVESWILRTADRPGFSFSVKLHQSLTHERDPDRFEGLVREFREFAWPLREAGRLAAVLMQFPWSFGFTGDNLVYVERLIDALKPLPLAVEVRQRNWLDEEFLSSLRAKGVAFCNIDQPPLNRCLSPTSVATADVAYVRLHGRNAKEWFSDGADVNQRYNYLYNKEELGEWAGRIEDLAGKAGRVLVYTNNHFCGQGVANALQLKAILLNRRLAVPAQLIHAFPELQEIAEPDAASEAADGSAAKVSDEKPPSRRPPREQTGWLFDDADS